MNVKVRNTFAITLTLNAREALWLKEMTQNALEPLESDKRLAIRMNLWDSLPSLPELQAAAANEEPRHDLP